MQQSHLRDVSLDPGVEEAPPEFTKLTDIPLDDPYWVRKLLRHWYLLQEVKAYHTGAVVVAMELEKRYYSSPLTPKHRSAIRWNLIEDRTQQESGRIMRISPRKVVQFVREGLHIMCNYGKPPEEMIPLEELAS